MERCLERMAAYRASGQTAQAWADANDVPMRAIASLCAHSRRWQERLDGVSAQAPAPPRPAGFVAARVGPGPALASVRVEVNAGSERPARGHRQVARPGGARLRAGRAGAPRLRVCQSTRRPAQGAGLRRRWNVGVYAPSAPTRGSRHTFQAPLHPLSIHAHLVPFVDCQDTRFAASSPRRKMGFPERIPSSETWLGCCRISGKPRPRRP